MSIDKKPLNLKRKQRKKPQDLIIKKSPKCDKENKK